MTKEKSKENARDSLIDAGVTVIAENGYSNSSIDDIVKLAQVSKGAFYHYFDSKQHFVVTIVKQRAEENLQRFRESHQGEVSLTRWIKDSFSTIITFPSKDTRWSLFSLEVMLAGMNPGREKIAELGEWIHATWRQTFVEMIEGTQEYKSGEITCEPELIAVGIMAMIDGLLIHSRIEPETFRREQYIDRLAPMLEYWLGEPESC